MPPRWSYRVRPTIALIVVGNPRTGSSVLARAMDATGFLGHPEEYFWRLQEPRWATVLGMPVPDDTEYASYIEAVVPLATTPNGVFGAKIFWQHVQDLLRRAASDPRLEDVPPETLFKTVFADDVRAVHVHRNALDAAISLWRAEVSNVWTQNADTPPPPAPARLDVWRVSVLHALHHAGDKGWLHLLRSAGIPIMDVTYSDVIADLAGVVGSIAEFADQRQPDGIPPPTSVRQADDQSVLFAREWTAATGGCADCSTGG